MWAGQPPQRVVCGLATTFSVLFGYMISMSNFVLSSVNS